MLKTHVTHLLTVTGAPVEYWCFALEYLAFVRSCTARHALQWKTPHELMFGDTPDISNIRYPFWSPVWYYTPHNKFPHPKMEPARFIGFAQDTSDNFCYKILTEPTNGEDKPQVLTRSVIRRRYPRQTLPPNPSPITPWQVFQSDGKTLLLDIACDDTFDSQSHFPASESQHQSDPISEEVNYDDPAMNFDMTLAQVYGPRKRFRTESTSIAHAISSPDPDPARQAPVAAAPAETLPPSDVHDNIPQVTQDSTNDSITSPSRHNNPDLTDDENVASSPMDTDSIHDITTSEYDDTLNGQRGLTNTPTFESIDAIESHHFHDGVLHLGVRWSTGTSSDVSYTLMKKDHPYDTAEYILSNDVGNPNQRYQQGKYQRWARSFMKQNKRILRRVLRLAGIPFTSFHSEQTFNKVSTRMKNSHHPSAILCRAPVTPSSGQGRKKRKTKPGRTR